MEMVMRSYPNDWVAESIMHRKGVGGGSSGQTHELTEEKQGTYLYTIGPYADPVLSIEPGDRVIVETRDAFEGKITSESDVPSELLEVPFLNPQCGPIFMVGASKGDVLAVHIESMAPRGPQPRGTCCMIKEFGGLTSTYYTATLNEPLPEKVRKVEVDEENVYWSDRVTLPYKPHIGTLSCSPQIDSINSLTPDDHGGNMDLPDMGPGTITYLPVRAPGALLYIGDARLALGRCDGHVWAEAARAELRFGAQLGEARHRRRGYQMQRRVVREAAGHHQLADVDDGLVGGERVEALEAGRLRPLRGERDRPPQGVGKAGIGVAALARDRRAIGPDDAYRRQRRTGLRGADEFGGEGHQPGPLPGRLGAPHPAALPVDHGIAAVAQDAAFGDQRLVDLGAGHGLDRITPERLDGAAARALRCHHRLSPCCLCVVVGECPHQGS